MDPEAEMAEQDAHEQDPRGPEGDALDLDRVKQREHRLDVDPRRSQKGLAVFGCHAGRDRNRLRGQKFNEFAALCGAGKYTKFIHKKQTFSNKKSNQITLVAFYIFTQSQMNYLKTNNNLIT